MAAAPTQEQAKAGAFKPLLREWGPVILLALIPALPLLVGGGLVNTRAGGDSPFLLLRLQQLVLDLRAGIFPARWMPQAAYGLGYPFFNFYASLPYYLAALLKLLGMGYITAIQATQALGFVLAGMAIYGLCRELGHGRAAGLLVSLVYSCAPFHMVNVYVRGDALSEFYAFVFYPLIPWALLRLQRRPSAHNVAWVALAFAGLAVTHNVSAMIFSPFVLLFALLLAAQSEERLAFALHTALALGGGALLSAWFWLPALAERANVYLKDMTTGYFHFAQHFRSLPGTPQAPSLVQRSLLFNWAITAERQPFGMGLLQSLLAAAGLVAISIWWMRGRTAPRRRGRGLEPSSTFAVLLLAGSTFMITPWSGVVWERLPLLQMAQFPWRFLSVQAFATSLVVAYLVPRKGRAVPVALVIGLATLGVMLGDLRPERLYIDEADVTPQRLMQYEYFTANVGTTVRADYLPRWVDPRPFTSEAFWQASAPGATGQDKPAPLALEGQLASAYLVQWKPTAERWSVEVTSPTALLAFHTYYYPGWEARVDGQLTPVEALAGLGYIGLRVGAGQHEIVLHLGLTRAQLIAQILSALAALSLLVALALPGKNDASLVVATSVALATVLVIVLGMQRLSGPYSTPGQLQDLTMDFDRVAYLHHNPGGVRFGEAARMTTYELSSEDVRAGETLRVTTHWNGVRSNGLLARLALVSPAQHLFGIQQALASAEQALSGDLAQYVLQLPADAMRGVYLLSMRVYGPDGEIRPVTADGETLGTTYLLPIRVGGKVPASSNAPLLQRFGDRIALCSGQTTQLAPGSLEITLTWRVDASPPQNYKIALRLRAAPPSRSTLGARDERRADGDESGAEVARLDAQPGYGFYPTSMWRPGEAVYDHYTLALDDGTPPGSHYRLDVTLYESASLRPIGTGMLPNVCVAQPSVREGYPVLHAFGPALALSEAQLTKTEWEQGETPMLLLKWAATAAGDRDYQCRVALRSQAGTRVAVQTVPLATEYPTSLWPQNAVVAVRYALQIPRDLPAGAYAVEISLMETASGSETEAFVLPFSLTVKEVARDFTIPAMQQTVGADFAGKVRLLGYDLQRTDKELVLTLHWQALSAIDKDLKVFVHLFDPASEKIVAQQDVLAGGDDHPTTRWVPREVVNGSVTLPLGGVPPGAYRLVVGLYQPEARLAIVAPQGWRLSSDRLLLAEPIPVQ